MTTKTAPKPDTSSKKDERKTMILTGASRGIGHATVRKFVKEGWRILTCSRQDFSEFCPFEGGRDSHVKVDLADPYGLAHGIEELRERLGGRPLHALVNNAGISPKGSNGERLDCLTTDLATWEHVMRVNFYAPVMLARGLFKELKAGKGSIVNVTSIVGSRVHPFAGTAYATSKAALATLTREMASDFGPYGIRVNAIAPGEIETDMVGPEYQKLAQQIPLRRLGSTDEVADVIYYLCSDQASYINGAELHINGGQHV